MSCRSPRGNTRAQKRGATLEMRDQTLRALLSAEPSIRSELRSAPGYAVFANIDSKILIVGIGNGYGVLTDNTRGYQKTYMRMVQAGGGWGIGIKTFRLVIVFRTRSAMRDFVESGWNFKGSAEATIKAGKLGGGIGQSLVLSHMKIYTLNESGLSLTAMLMGTKVSRDSELN